MSYEKEPTPDEHVYVNTYSHGAPSTPIQHEFIDSDGWEDGRVWRDGE